jgi:hypothetical protein
MLPYTIDDSIEDPLTCSVEVTIDFGNNHKRWCFFVTPQLLATVGDWVKGTTVRMHLGVAHQIVVSELNEDIIDRVLKELYDEELLEEHTIPLV